MKQKRVPGKMAGRGWRTRRIADGRSIRRVCGGIVGLGMIGAFVAAGRCLAQNGVGGQLNEAMRLTVRPHTMATGTRTERAGLIQVDSFPQDTMDAPPDTMYIPQSCVGARRCPLLVYFDAGGWTCCATWYGKVKPSRWDWLGPVAEKYGIMILNYQWQWRNSTQDLDRTLKEVLRTFAIDPDKIAIAGRCATGNHPIAWGDNNPEVFSRIATFTADYGDPPVRPPNQSVEYLLANSHRERHSFAGVRMLRERGYPVKHLTSFRAHSHSEEDYDFLGHWLQESWAIPDPAARPTPYTFAAPAPVLTTGAMTQMSAFWNRFTKEPDSILVDGRRAHVREVIMPIGEGQISVLMVNMPALAAQHPSVAAALNAAGLTAEQHDAYRFALVSTLLGSQPENGLLRDTTSVLAKNVQFMNAHPDEFRALEETKMWLTP